ATSTPATERQRIVDLRSRDLTQLGCDDGMQAFHRKPVRHVPQVQVSDRGQEPAGHVAGVWRGYPDESGRGATSINVANPSHADGTSGKDLSIRLNDQAGSGLWSP